MSGKKILTLILYQIWHYLWSLKSILPDLHDSAGSKVRFFFPVWFLYSAGIEILQVLSPEMNFTLISPVPVALTAARMRPS